PIEPGTHRRRKSDLRPVNRDGDQLLHFEVVVVDVLTPRRHVLERRREGIFPRTAHAQENADEHSKRREKSTFRRHVLVKNLNPAFLRCCNGSESVAVAGVNVACTRDPMAGTAKADLPKMYPKCTAPVAGGSAPAGVPFGLAAIDTPPLAFATLNVAA